MHGSFHFLPRMHAIMWVAIGGGEGGGLGPAIIWESPETSISHSPKTTI